MDYEKYTDFENFALEPISRLLRRNFDDSYPDYNKELSKKHRGTIQEIRENKHKYNSDRDQLIQYISDLSAKVCGLKISLFQETAAATIYLLDDIELNDSSNTVMNCVRSLHQMVASIYNDVQANFDLISHISETTYKRKSRSKGQRNPDRGSFVLKNPDVNFNAIHARLIAGNHPFIDPTTFCNDLTRVFQGVNIAEKVIWYEANSLRYFIRELYEKELIESPNEGKWRRTILCFKPEEGEFEAKNFKNTKDPVASTTLILDDVIELFSS